MKICSIPPPTSVLLLQFWPWLATKGHAVAQSPLSLPGWEGECKEKGKTRGLG